MNTKILLLTVLCFFSTIIYGQSDGPLKYKAIAAYDGNDVILRWAPQDYDSWKWGIDNGYRVERVTIRSNGAQLTAYERNQSKVILANPILPWPVNDWETLASTNDLAGVAAGALYGTGFEVNNLSNTDLMTIYNVSQERENRFGFSLFAADQSFEVAEAMGIALIDATVVAGDEYLYKVVPENDPSGYITNGLATVDTDETITLPSVTDLEATPGDRVVVLKWSQTDLKEDYTGYYIERSSDNGATYSQVNQNPVIYTSTDNAGEDEMYFMDSLVNNSDKYLYRVYGHSPLGFSGPTSTPVMVKGVPAPIDEIANITGIVEEELGKLLIHWRFPSDKENQILGFNIQRADKKDGLYKQINSSIIANSDRTYIDATPNSAGYYKVVIVDRNNNEVESFSVLGQIKDTTPPKAPTGASGVAENSGKVTLNWANNTDSDLMGYRVYKSNSPDGEYAQVTKDWISQPKFFDQVKPDVLEDLIYYKIVAIDKHENYSPYSEVCIVQRPDIIPPAAPDLRNVTPILEGIHLEWAFSYSDDVESHRLQRKPVHTNTWETILSIPNIDGAPSSLEDTLLNAQWKYDYRMLAVDEANNIGSSKIISIQPLDDGMRDRVENLNGFELNGIDEDIAVAFGYGDTGIFLSWEYPQVKGLHSFVILRSYDGLDPIFYKTVFPEESVYSSGTSQGMLTHALQDIDVKNERTYTYQVFAKHVDGGMSPLSELFTLNL